ncbi:MAG: endonuclease/exonuclease/phosphatase family protein [bacterium]|nr:endonuclease/exonuclease/phosphatase family protein [bacterium]
MDSNFSHGKPPNILDHDLNRHFVELLKFESTQEMEASDLWKEIRVEAQRVLDAVVAEELASEHVRDESRRMNSIKALAWNIERGIVFDGILDALQNHTDLRDKDLLMLTELDYGMARSGNRFVAQEIAKALNLNYAFAPVYIALQKGSGVESEMEGENTKSIHGLAMFSKWPMRNVHAIPLPNGKDKMWGKEKRLGSLRALFADVEHPLGTSRAVTVHLDAHCSRAHRQMQMRLILDHLDALPKLPTLIGGDWNTTTFNSQSSTRAIMGYWRRVLMGPKNVAENHLPHPERFFEKPLFEMLERRGYSFRDLNNIGQGTLHYHVESIEKNTNLRDWVPEWCFPFIFWAANRVGGSVSGRLDWFAGQGLEPAAGSEPKTIGDLVDSEGTPLSDHDAITIDIVPTGYVRAGGHSAEQTLSYP